LQKKIYGCLAGLCLGDAMGMPTEFLTPVQIRELYGWVTGIVTAPPWHPHSVLPVGSITDDSGQALAVARAYSEDGQISAERMAVELLAWAQAMPDDQLSVFIGPSTKKALEQLGQGISPLESGKSGYTNGAAMRAAVTGLVNAGNFKAAFQDALLASLPTHGAGPGIAGAAAVACAVAEAARAGSDLDSILDAAKAGARKGASLGTWKWSTPLEGRIELAERLVRETPDPRACLQAFYDFVGVDLLVSESVATAFGIVRLAAGNPMLAVQYGANVGGDTDTIAAIAGAVCGAWMGVDAIQEDLLARVVEQNRLPLAEQAERLARIAGQKSKKITVSS